MQVHGDLGRFGHAQLPGDAACAAGIRGRTGGRAGRGRPAAAGAHREPGAAASAGGMPLGQGAAGGEADPRALHRAGAPAPGPVPRRSRHLLKRGGHPDRQPAEPAGCSDPTPRNSAATCSPSRPTTGSPASPASATPTSWRASSSTCAGVARCPKARLAYLFPNGHSAQIVLRLRPDLTEAARHRALGLIREAVYEATPRRSMRLPGPPGPLLCAARRPLRDLRRARRRRRAGAGAEGLPAGPLRRSPSR